MVDFERMPILTKWLDETKWDVTKVGVALDKLLEAGMTMDPLLVQKAARTIQWRSVAIFCYLCHKALNS